MLLALKKEDVLCVLYYDADKHYHKVCGQAKVLKEEKRLVVCVGKRQNISINFEDIKSLEIQK